jgi:hypothetical protein
LTSNNSNTYKNPIITANNDSGTLTIRTNAGNPSFAGPITLNGSNLRFEINTAGTGAHNVTGAISGTGDITAVTSTGESTNFTNASINNNGRITNLSTGVGNMNITGALGGSVTQLIQNSATSIMSVQNANAAFTGVTHVVEGTLSASAAATLGTGNVFVEDGGTLSLAGAATIGNAATLTIDNGGIIKLGASAASTESVGALILGGVSYGPGTTFNAANNWGGLGNSTGFFAGSTGGLAVVPEPGGLALIGLALPALMRRRRRK